MAGSSSAASSTTDKKDFEGYIPSSVEHERRYHIFLSFRGTETRDFASHLYQSLVDARFNVFMDDKRIEKGDNIGDILTKAIQDSTVHIPILSPYYATSTWCLSELSQIWACKCDGVRIIPLFYDVDPKHVRYQTGPYEEAFQEHTEKGRHNEEKMDEWKKALKHVSLLSGWCYKKESSVERFAWQVVQDIRRTLKINYFHVAKKPVGISARVEQVTNLLQLDKLDNKDDKDCPPVTVGIWGMGGLGKTTLCKALYNSIHQKFEATCFLFDIRTTALTALQEQILFSLEGVEMKLSGVVEQDKVMMKNYLSNRNRKALIILDDVDDGKQPDDLFGDWDGRGGRIIITTRDREMLSGQADMTLYPMELLSLHQSLELFCRHAFKTDFPEKTYEDTTHKIAKACQGLPLSLEIIGAHLRGKKDLNIWREVLAKIQALDYKKLYECLRISYDALGKEEKQIFLDIACFFNGTFCGHRYPYRTKDFYTEFWKNLRYKFLCTSLMNLEEKSLIKIEDGHVDRQVLRMHDHLRDLGRQIVKEESMADPGERSRLWCSEDIKTVMARTKERQLIKGIMLTGGEELDQTDPLALMPELNFLCLDGVTTTREIKMLPSELKYLIFSNSCLQKNGSLTEGLRAKCHFGSYISPEAIGQLQSMRFLDMSGTSQSHLPDAFGELGNLEELYLTGCDLTELPQSFGNLTKLKILDISKNLLRSIPKSFNRLESLVDLNASSNGMLEELCNLPKSLRHLDLNCCVKLQNMPSMRTCRFYLVTSLETHPELSGCKNITGLTVPANLVYRPQSVVNLTIRHLYELERLSSCKGISSCMVSVETPDISWFRSLARIPHLNSLRELTLLTGEEFLDRPILSELYNPQKIFMCDMVNVGALSLSSCVSPTQLPRFELLPPLEKVKLELCEKLEELLLLLGSLINLTLMRCFKLQKISSMSHMKYLGTLDVSWCISLTRIPELDSIHSLTRLSIKECWELVELPSLPKGLRNLRVKLCNKVQKMSTLSRIKSLDTLYISCCKSLTALPELDSKCPLQTLILDYCTKLEKLPLLPESVIDLFLIGCMNLRKLPSMSHMKKLETLDLSECIGLTKLPQLSCMQSLRKVVLDHCEKLEELPSLPDSSFINLSTRGLSLEASS